MLFGYGEAADAALPAFAPDGDYFAVLDELLCLFVFSPKEYVARCADDGESIT